MTWRTSSSSPTWYQRCKVSSYLQGWVSQTHQRKLQLSMYRPKILSLLRKWLKPLKKMTLKLESQWIQRNQVHFRLASILSIIRHLIQLSIDKTFKAITRWAIYLSWTRLNHNPFLIRILTLPVHLWAAALTIKWRRRTQREHKHKWCLSWDKGSPNLLTIS